LSVFTILYNKWTEFLTADVIIPMNGKQFFPTLRTVFTNLSEIMVTPLTMVTKGQAIADGNPDDN
jgi:hypothetical protein